MENGIRDFLAQILIHDLPSTKQERRAPARSAQPTTVSKYVEIKCQPDATEVFIADLIACSTCFGHHYAHHQGLKSIDAEYIYGFV